MVEGIDYTTFDKGLVIDEDHKIEGCPKCGRLGRAHHTKVRAVYVHITNPAGSGKLVKEGCEVKKFWKEEK
jgi:hypothetical protein